MDGWMDSNLGLYTPMRNGRDKQLESVRGTAHLVVESGKTDVLLCDCGVCVCVVNTKARLP